MSRPAFTNDFDHSSEPSREGSVQIVESHRHTFFVPSSDDEVDSEDEEDEVQIASSVHGDEEEISAATTPDRQAVRNAYVNAEGHAKDTETRVAPEETRGLNLKGPSLYDLLTKTAKDGTSQENPINLEGGCTNIIDVDTESEDDGPDVLPFYDTSRPNQSQRSRVFDEPRVVSQISTKTMPTMTTVAEKEKDRDPEIHRHSIVLETQAKEPTEDEVGEQGPASVHAESTAEATDDFDTEDDDGFDYDHEFLADEDLEEFPDPPVADTEPPISCKPKVIFRVGGENPHYTTLTPSHDEFRSTSLSHLSANDAIDVSQSAQPSSAWTQRAPSPSDAALARKASDPKMSLSRDIFDNFPVPRWPATAKTTHSHSTEQIPDNAALHGESLIPFSWPDLQSPEPRSYEQGPFSRQPKAAVSTPRSPKPDNVKDQPKKAPMTWAYPHEDNDDLMMNTDRFARIRKEASKITIPSLVENYLAENPRSLKRKYGGIDGSNDVEGPSKVTEPSSPVTRTSSYKRTFMEANPVDLSYPLEEDLFGTTLLPRDPTDFNWQSGEDKTAQRQIGLGDQETPLPDAQPRENVLQIPTASMSQDSGAEPTLDPVPLSRPTQGHDTEGPARKKARTSSSSSGGIGKFVMGVGFGLLGAAAAFIATIPASVYEEALREFGNAA